MRHLYLATLVLCIYAVSNAQIVCPPDTEIACYDYDKLLVNIEVEKDKFELVPQVIERSSCNEPMTVGYFLYDLDNNKLETTATCTQQVVVKKFDIEQLVWPASLIEVNDINDLPIEVFAEGLFPEMENTCNMIYTYEDIFINSEFVRKIVRTWTVLDWCSARTFSYVQRISEKFPSVNSLLVDINNCGGSEVQLASYEIHINGRLVDDNLCDYFTLKDVLNCIAEDNNLGSDDKLSLALTSQHRPLKGINAIDFVKIQRHILGLEVFSSPCSLWAADVNSDHKINGLDLVELRKLVLGIYLELPQAEPELYSLDGSPSELLIFKGDEFPLSSLQIIEVNKGNVKY